MRLPPVIASTALTSGFIDDTFSVLAREPANLEVPFYKLLSCGSEASHMRMLELLVGQP
jgi:hypothetical protein